MVLVLGSKFFLHPWYTYGCKMEEGKIVSSLYLITVIGTVQIYDPLPPMSSFVTIFGLPPPSHFTGVNGDKLLTVNGWRKINKTLCGNGQKLVVFYEKSVYKIK